MSHSYSQNHLHIVFSTKDRQKLIEPALRPNLWSYMAESAETMDSWCWRMAAWRTTYTC
ncbi:MAG TPA: hypothetical protein VGH51_21330 [Candidatus Angelobacter sp.]|jgi:REP element-mobilizing transposase RayT